MPSTVTRPDRAPVADERTTDVRELHAVDLTWRLPPSDALWLTDDDMWRDRRLYREALILAWELLYERTRELARVRDQFRALREQVLREERSR